MALSSSSSPVFLLLTIFCILLCSSHATFWCYSAIFSFGDSNSDTGNLIRTALGQGNHAGYPPYGETFFHHPTGRFCDGRIALDFLAGAFGLPLVPPYLGGQGDGVDFRRGVNFAVAGATALNNEVYREMGLDITWTNYSLGYQMEWFKGLLPSLYQSDSDRYEAFGKALFVVGEIGGTDHNFQFFQGRTLEEVKANVPRVINAISIAINQLIELGARTLMVPSDYPIGCVSDYLSVYHNSRPEDYEPNTGCLKWLNEFAEYHNSMLLQELDRIRQQNPNITIIYADYYNAVKNIIFTRALGKGVVPLSTCCGTAGPYNCDSSGLCNSCGNPALNFNVCDDPSAYLIWDGLHLTEAASKIVADGVLSGRFASLPIGRTCPHSEHDQDQTQQDLGSI